MPCQPVSNGIGGSGVVDGAAAGGHGSRAGDGIGYGCHVAGERAEVDAHIHPLVRAGAAGGERREVGIGADVAICAAEGDRRIFFAVDTVWRGVEQPASVLAGPLPIQINTELLVDVVLECGAVGEPVVFCRSGGSGRFGDTHAANLGICGIPITIIDAMNAIGIGSEDGGILPLGGAEPAELLLGLGMEVSFENGLVTHEVEDVAVIGVCARADHRAVGGVP